MHTGSCSMDGGLKEKKMNINIEIKGQQAHIVNQQSLISGTSNLEEIKFDFSSEWDGYTKTAVIYVDDYSISESVKVLVEKDVVSAEKLPDWLFREECELYIGVFGDNSEGRRITSTIVCQKVKKGVPVDVVDEITPDIYNQIIKIMCDAKALVKEADEKIEVNKCYLEQAEQKANDAADYADRAGNYLEEVVGQKTDVEKLIADIDVKVNESTTNIANITEAKMEDIANVTNAKLEDINNTASAQIESINTVANQNIKAAITSITQAAANQIIGINRVADGRIYGINETAEGKIYNINNTALSQIDAINNTATNQIEAINNTAISQIENMTVKYSDMCRTLGIEHEGYLKIKNTKGGSMDVSKFKYIKFGMIYKAGNVGSQGITIPTSSWHFYIKENAEANKSTMVTSDKEYDISSLSKLNYSLMILYEYDEDLFIEYKLYNESEETTEE